MVNHIILDFESEKKYLNNKSFLLRTLIALPKKINMKILKGPIIVEGTKRPGYTGFVIIEESHISIHTFTDKLTANIDIFSCKDLDVKKVVEYIKKKFRARNTKIYSVPRDI